jgi:hypothetical protein
MNKACLLIVVPALLVALGFAQTTAGGNSDPTSIKGCLGGSDGRYTFVEDNTGRNFKITTSTVDLKPHVGHEVTLVGQKASATASSAEVDNGFAVTSLNMSSDHCAAAAAPAASISVPADNAIPTPTDAAVPASTTAPADSAALATAAPAALPMTITPPSETAVVASAPAAIAATPAETASAPAAVATISDTKAPPETAAAPPAAHRTQLPAEHRRPSATPATISTPAEPSSTPVADAATLPPTDDTASATVTDSAPVAAIPVVAAKSAFSWLWIPIVVVVLILGAVAPLLSRWRKRKLVAQSGEQNLSFSHRASSEPGVSDKPTGRKAA